MEEDEVEDLLAESVVEVKKLLQMQESEHQDIIGGDLHYTVLQCTLHTAHCTLHTAHCTLYTAHGTRHTAHGTWHMAHGTLHCTLNSTLNCTLYTVHCTLYTVGNCTAHSTEHCN